MHEGPNFEFYCILTRLKRNSHVWPVAVAPSSPGPDARLLAVRTPPEPLRPERQLAARLSPSLQGAGSTFNLRLYPTPCRARHSSATLCGIFCREGIRPTWAAEARRLNLCQSRNILGSSRQNSWSPDEDEDGGGEKTVLVRRFGRVAPRWAWHRGKLGSQAWQRGAGRD